MIPLCHTKSIGHWHIVDANSLYFNNKCLTLLAASFHRFREVLATNNIRPWELASVFKQVMGDFLRQKEYDEEHNLSVQPAQHRQMEAWTSRYKMKQSFVTPMVPNCGDHPREEIPTISGYVDWAMKPSNLFTGSNRDWSLSYYYPAPFRPIGAYSTTLWEERPSKMPVALSKVTEGKVISDHIHSMEKRYKNFIICISYKYITVCDKKCEESG